MKEPFDGDEKASSAAWLGKTLADDSHYALVAVVDGVVRGFLGGEIRRTTDDFFHAPYFYINHLYVDRTIRHAGLGRALMNEIARWGREKGMHALDLEVGDLNAPGIKFYDSMGFTTISRRMARIL
jgi:ribosomal protein S18 acetylase RimI-like enzyme